MVLAHRTARAAATLTRPSPLQRLHPSSSSSSSSSPFVPSARSAPATLTRRGFHLGALGDAVVLTADGISFVHHAGLPWFLTIPLVALGVNVSLRLPVQYYTRRLVVRRNALTPLVRAWGARHAATVPVPVPGQGGSRNDSNTDSISDGNAADGSRARQLWQLRVAGLTERSRRRIYKAWRVQRYKSLAPLLSMAPFVVVTEALRRLCGAPLGWLGRSVGLGGGGGGDSSPAADTPQRLLDPCLADGGCLWFPDLTAMDPCYALPLLCAALLARSSWGRLSRDQLSALLTLDPAARGAQSPMARIRTAAGRTLLLVPLLPVLFADLPSAIFLYWATSFALTEVNEALLARVLPRTASGLATSERKPRLVLPYLRGTHVHGKPGDETRRNESIK